ncbi:hypothetical protein [Pararhizobium sp. LjRoot238]|uniref:hypothetical protein n=1 Tax=Pararhizobium sp. LjRoot238 TaxID=3342293 RepID=UPI003ECEEFDC
MPEHERCHAKNAHQQCSFEKTGRLSKGKPRKRAQAEKHGRKQEGMTKSLLFLHRPPKCDKPFRSLIPAAYSVRKSDIDLLNPDFP